MANNSEDIKWLYGKLKAKGYDIGNEQEFTSSLANDSDRDWYYDKAVGMGLNVGSKDDFNALYAPVSAPAPQPKQEKPVQPQSATQPQTPATETGAPQQTAQPTVSTPTPAPQETQPTWQPTVQDKIRMSYNVNSMMSDFNARSRARIEQGRRVAERNTPEGRRKLKAAKFQAQLAGTPTQVMGLTPDVSASSSGNGQGEGGEQAKPLLSGQGPVPYGVVEVDGQRKTQWLLPDGSLTTDFMEADKAEYSARRVRLMNQFVGRMKENGLDPSKQEDVQRQAQLDYEAPIRKAVAAAVQADDERSDKEQEAYMSNPLNMVGGVNAALGHAAARKEAGIGDLNLIAENAYNSLPPAYKRELIASYTDYFTKHPEDTNGKTIDQAAKDAAKSVVYGQVHEEYVKRNGPQSKNEFFVRKMLELNPASVALSGTINPYGQAYAELDAMERYGAEHRGLDIAGMIAGMAIDPTTYLGGWAGNIAFKNATRAAGKVMAKKAVGDVAGRYAATTLAGRIIGGMAAGGANFGTFEAVKDAERQLYQGGDLNPETGELEGFSFGSVLNSGVHGIGMGTATGVVSPLIGNVADKAVKATTSTAGKVAMRGTEVLASTLAEGTVFSIPEWISGDQDAFDVWTDNMAMMAGFKLSHGIKTAPAMIRSLRPVKPTGDRPLSREERIHNNKSFAELLRERLDESSSDIAMSKEEREELKRKGYGDLSDLFAYDPEHKSRKAAAHEAEGDYIGTTGLSRAVDYEPTLDETGNPTFDGYAEMERLMEDESVSEATRARAYYILTGRNLPPSTVTGWSREENEDGTITISSHSQHGSIVTSRTFSGEKEAQREIERINRQSELNTIDIGEQYRNAEAQQRVMAAAINDVSRGADLQTVYNIYEAVRRGDKNVTEEQRLLADMIDEAIERNTDAGAEVSPAGIRERISEETGVDIDKAIRKEPGKRTEDEQEAVKRYVRELFPEPETYEPTPEEAEADRIYEESRLLYGRFEQGDPEAQAEIDAISLRMTEAHQLCEEAFGDEAEYWMYHVKENPWGIVNDPNLTPDQKDAVLYYINAKASLDGVLDASNEGAADKRQKVQDEVAHRTHKERGVIVPATMKADDRPVYIIKGEVAMFPDGSGVDVRNSSGDVIILDDTGEYKFSSPDQILTVGEAIDPQTELQTAYEAIDREQEAIISAATEGAPGAQHSTENTDEGVAEAEETPESVPNVEEYDRGYEEGTQVATTLDDNILNTAIDDLRGRDFLTDEWRGRLEAYEYEQQRRAQEGIAEAEVPAQEQINEAGEGAEAAATPSALDRVPVDEQTGDPILTHESVDADTAWEAATEFFGTPEDALTYVQAEIGNAKTAITTAEKAVSKVKPTGGMTKYRNDLNAARERVEAAKTTLAKWQAIEEAQKRRKAEEAERIAAERAAKDTQLHDEAVARFEEEQRIKAEKQAEQAAIGTHAVNPKIKEKWDASPKVDGHPDVITLSDGSTLTGHYVMTEAGAASASHDIHNSFEPTEGFPIDKNGQSVNDRDYKRDMDAQQIVHNMADSYDSRAMQTPVIVSKDGIVLSGNNRTMSGDMAATQGTDGAYLEYLGKYGAKYGFTPEQVQGMEHPRVVFVPDDDLPYDANTFARFNAQEMKSQSKPEAAIKLGKIVDDSTFNRIVVDLNKYDRLSDFYADQEAAARTLGELAATGAINDKQLPELRTGTSLSAAGRELIENTLIGKVFQAEPDAVRMILSMPTLRQGVILGLNEIANNRTLADKGYDLGKELSAAVDLAFRAKTSQPEIYKEGMPVSPFGRQQGLFDDEYGESSVSDTTTLLLADMLNSAKPSDMRKVLAMYNKAAGESAAGAVDIFSESGKPDTKEEILSRVNELFNNGTAREKQELVDAAIADRKQRASAEPALRGGYEAAEQAADAGRRGEGSEERAGGDAGVDGEGTNNLQEERITAPLSETETDEYGKPFVISSDGSTIFGGIEAESGLEEAPIRLSVGENRKDNNGTNHGYGLLHIEAGHGEQIRNAGFASVEEFVENVARNYETIREGNRYGKKPTYLLEVKDGHNNTLFIQLSNDGTYWNVNSAGIFRERYSRNKPIVSSLPTIGSSSNAETAEVNHGQNEGAAVTSGNSSKTSGRKDNALSEDKQGMGVESSLGERITEAGMAVNTEPTEAQKEAGNYRKGHVNVEGFNVTIEQPKGSVRRGKDADGNPWESKMNNTYGYIRGTEGVDGDHIDVFLSDTPEAGNVYVVDQYEPDGTFDEHKVMYGFPDAEAARTAYLSNYESGWDKTRRIDVTGVTKEGFKKWIGSSRRKTKPFNEYKSVKALTEEVDQTRTNINKEGIVTDGEGKPLTFYHGTPNKEVTSVSQLEPGHKRMGEEAPARYNGDGVSFSPEMSVAQDYAAEAGHGKGRIFPANIRLTNPYYTLGVANFTPEEAAEFTAGLKAKGHDGIINYSSASMREARALPAEVIVFDKSAILPIEDKDLDGFGYSITPTTYTNKKGKTSDVWLVKFDGNLSKEEKAALDTYIREPLAEGRKTSRGWYDRKEGGYMMRSEEAAKGLTGMLDNAEAVADAQPLSAEDYKEAIAPAAKEGGAPAKAEDRKKVAAPVPMNRVDVEGLFNDLSTKGETKFSDHSAPVKPESAPAKPEPKRMIVDDEMRDMEDELRSLLGIDDSEGDRGDLFRNPEDFSNKERMQITSLGITYALKYFDQGIVSFPDFADRMVRRMGEKIRPWLKAFYGGARDIPGYDHLPFTPADEVKAFDVMNFDKENKDADPMRTVQGIVAESRAEAAVAEAKKEITEQRNQKRKERDEQTTADTEAIAKQAEATASEAEATAESAVDEQSIAEASEKIDDALEKVNDQLALLGYYEAERVDKDFNEAYGYMRNAEKKALADAVKLAKQLVKDLGIEIDKVTGSTTAKKSKKPTAVSANIAPAGGDISIRLPLNEGRELYVSISLDPSVERGDVTYSGDNLQATSIMYRVETPDASGYDRFGRNCWADASTTYSDLLKAIQRESYKYLPETNAEGKEYKSGDSIQYSADGGKSWTDGKVVEINDDGSLKLDTGLAPVLYVNATQEQVRRKGLAKAEPSKKEPKQETPAEASESATDKAIETLTGKKPVRKTEVKPKQAVGDLFGGLFDEPIKDEKETELRPRSGTGEREGGHEPRQDEPLGTSQRNEDGGSDGGGMAGRGGNDTMPDTGRGSGVSAISSEHAVGSPAKAGTSKRDEPLTRLPEAERKNTHNNRAERGMDYAPKGVDARIRANIKAIELAQELLESGLKATPEQMAVLRQFSGWGGLGKAFNDDGYSMQIKKLLGSAYEDAVKSRKSAYYTPSYIIDTMWDIARAMGFKGGNVLEGSAGIGNILGLMPQDMSERSNIHAVEYDSTTGGILSLLYPDAKVDIQGFEATKIPNGSVDLSITNVPFITGWNVADTSGDKDLSRKFRDIHDFCIAKNIRKLKPGGVGIFITSSGTLDNSDKLRAWITNEGASDAIGAFRMNNQTFGGTGATSDIIVVRKRVNGQKSPHAIDISEVTGARIAEYEADGKKRNYPMSYNKYFFEHPENMAGEMMFNFEKGETFQPTSRALFPAKGKDQAAMLKEWAVRFRDMDFEASPEDKPAYAPNYDSVGNEVKTGSMITDSQGRLCTNMNGTAVPVMGSTPTGYSKMTPEQKAKVDAERVEKFNRSKIKGRTRQECLKDYNELKKALADVLQYQTENADNEGLEPLLKKLNQTFDRFVGMYGNLHKNTQLAWLRNDVDYPSILALESFEERPNAEGERIRRYGKTDIFSRRVVEKEIAPKPANVKDGIIASIYMNGRIDLPYISEALGRSPEEVKKEIISSGLGFENPNTTDLEVSYEYLSGNVREKLRQAQDNNEDGRYSTNIKALERVIPMNIPAHLIEFSLGSSWITPKLYEDFIKERTGVSVRLKNAGGTWFVGTPETGTNTELNRSQGIFSEMFKSTIFGHQLMEAAITNRSITVSRTYKHSDGTSETVTDKDATQACAAKIDEIRQDFKDWARQRMQQDPEMSDEIERIYNEKFNNYVARNIPEEFIPEHFGGAAHVVNGKPFKLRPHQAKAVIRGTMQSQLLAHEVGTGKTYTLISTAMEMRRLGTARKPMIVVQNATVGQFVESAKALYPNARILTIEEADRTAEGRKNFYAKIKYNDWDMIVVPQSVFERIPDSEERQIKFIQDKIEEKLKVLEDMKEEDPDGKSMIVRQAESELEKSRDELNKITQELEEKRGKKKEKDEKREAQTKHNAEVRAMEMLDRETDDVENFDEMGIDAILVDEAHEYKHLGFSTAMQRGVKGVDPSYSKKAQGVYLKTLAVKERNNGRNVIFATGTPISNTAAEIWTFMRYLLDPDMMKEYGIYYFDDFVRNFGNLQQMLEFTTSGKFKENNRFAGYVNLPELVRIWSGAADTVLTREAGGVNDKIPKMEGDKAQDIYLPQTRALRSVMLFVKSELDRYENMTGKEKKQNSHIPLVMYGLAKAAAVDARLVVAGAEDDPNSKTNEAVRQTLNSLKETESYKGTVAIFADNYQNKKSGFNLYEDIRQKLIDKGVPADQIVVMRSDMTVKKKLDIFDRVNRGDIRVIMGSTFTLGTGVNIQERLHTLIHVDAPNRPMDYTQRNGRILRQGNLHKDMGLPVRVLRFGVEDSLDVTAYQRLKTKGAIADSIMNGKELISNAMENRSMEEDEDVFGDITAQLSGSEYAMLKNQAEKQVRKYTSKLKQWEAQQTHIHNQLPRLRGQIKAAEQRIEEAQKHLEVIGTERDNKITIGPTTYPNIDAMADLFTEHNKRVKTAQDEVREGSGERTMTMNVNVGGIDFTINTTVNRKIANNGQLSFESERNMTYSCESLGMEDVPVSGSRLKAAIEDIVGNVMNGDLFRERIEKANNSIERMSNEVAQLESQKGKPFEHVKELEEAEARLEEYTEKMKAELAEKEAKYADIDATVEAAEDVAFIEEEEEEETEETKKEKGRELSRLVTDGNSLDFLDAQGHRSAYRYAQFVPGGLTKYGTGYVREGVRPPMTAIDSETQDWRAPMVFNEWEQSVEGMRKDNGKADLVQGNGRTTGNVAYNPYFHIRVHPLNDQFSAAYDRPELVVVEGDYPESELTSGYRAEGAKNAVGLTDWHAGSVNGQLSPGKKVQTVLSRYFKPRRIVPWSEVAERIMDHIAGEDVTFPLNVVPPRLRAELSKRGAKFHGISGSVSKDQRAHLEEVERELAAGNHDFGVEGGLSDSDIAKFNQRIDRLSSTDPNTMEGAVTLLSDKLNTPIRVISRKEAEAEGYRRKKGWYDRETGQITVVADNHRNVGDIADTAVHEAVGHHGLRQLFGTEEKLNNFLDEAYNISNDRIKTEIDRRTEKMMDDEADRLREKMRQEHEARGENPEEEYYSDMAKARIEAEKQREQIRRDATEEYAADLGMKIGEEGFERMDAEELTFWGKLKGMLQKALDRLLAGLKLPKMRAWTDKEWSYVLWKSWRNLRETSDSRPQHGVAAEGALAEAEDIVRREKSNFGASERRLFRDGDLGLEEAITKMKADTAAATGAGFASKEAAMRAIGGNLSKLRQAMARQREYDITTVKSMTDLGKILLDAGLLDDLSKYETKRILTAIKDAAGREDTSKQVQRLMDIMVDNQLRMGANYFGKLLSVKGSRVDGRGIEVQGELDPDGQKIAQVAKKATTRTLDDIENMMAEAMNRMSSRDQALADEAALEYAGLQIAHQYVEEIRESKNEEKELRKSIDDYKAERDAEAKEAKESIELARLHKDAGRMSEYDFNILVHDIEDGERARWEAFKQYAEATNEAIRQNKIERAEAYRSLAEQLGGVLGESVRRAKQWREAEKQRVEDIHHNANSDMEGRATNEHHKADRLQKFVNNGILRFLLAPLGTFDQMLRMFGSKSVRGEGYLWNRYMRGWVDCTEKEYTGYRDALKRLDEKVREVFGNSPGDKPAAHVRSWGDLFAMERRLPKGTVRFWDGGEMREHELTQGNLLYIYMTDKMTDGRMKLRRMGIMEEDVERIKDFVDPRFKELADWMQEEFLPEKRNGYNEVHKRMFGTGMAAIENYFPLKILANARTEDVDVADDAGDNILPATSTGSIIKRKRNNLALDVTGADAFSVILDHIQQMERWAAFAEYNRDLNTLLSYKRFRNQVMNMTSAYGAGKTLWRNFRNVASMAAGAYRPPIAPLDKAAVNVAKGVTAAKVSFRVFTALKQFLSMPAYASDSNPIHLAANIANPYKAWKWSMENLPLFEKRWKSRMAGDPRLMKSEMDWKMWRSRIVEIAGRVGMSPNAFVDALTVSIGARSMYQTKLAKYERYGYTPEEARKRALQDASILFNQTQQSSEGAFLSTMQVDRSWLSVLFTVFRNSSMSYTRQLYDAMRNIGHRLRPGYKGLTEEFMAKQMRRDGIDPDQAERNAKQEYRRGIIRDLVRVGVFGCALQLAWNLGAYLPYLLFGQNSDEKDKMWDDVLNHTMFGSVEGLTGGDVMSAAGEMWMNGEGNPEQLTKEMPLASDVVAILRKMDKDYVSALNDVVNLLVQSGLGFNPQSLTDAAVAVMDYCGEDAQTSRECALLISRIINCPQSQIDKIYFDEIDATGEEASTMTPEEIAERYAEYKLNRNAPLTGWAYGEEGRAGAMDKQRKIAESKMKERLTGRLATERTRELLEDFEKTAKKEKELHRLKKRDGEAYRRGRKELREGTDMRRHNRAKRYNHDIKRLTEKWMNAKTPQEADSIARAMLNARERMLIDVDSIEMK